MNNNSPTAAVAASSSKSFIRTTNTYRHHTLLLTALACLGFGICCGFVFFYILYHSTCLHLLQNIDLQHETMSTQYQTNITSCQTSLKDCQTNLELSKTTISNEYSTLVIQYTDLLQQHDITVTQLKDVQLQITLLESTIQQQQVEIKTLHEQIQTCTLQNIHENNVWQQKYENIKLQLVMTQSMLHEKITLSSSSSSSSSSNNKNTLTSDDDDSSCPTLLFNLQNAIRSRYIARLLNVYGNSPSYLVEFTIQVPDILWSLFSTSSSSSSSSSSSNENTHSNSMHNTTTFVIQLNQIHTYPITTWTFLQLIEKGLYIGTQLVVPRQQTTTNNNYADFILGGIYYAHEYVSINKRIQANITRHIAEYTGGYSSTEPFLWHESSALAMANAAAAGAGLDVIVNDSNDNNNNDAAADTTPSSSSSTTSTLQPLPSPCDPMGGFGFATKRSEFVILTSLQAKEQVVQYYNNNNNNNGQSQHESSSSSSSNNDLTCPGRIVHGLNIIQQIIHAITTISLQQQQQHDDDDDLIIPPTAATIINARIISHKFEQQQQQQRPSVHKEQDHDEL